MNIWYLKIAVYIYIENKTDNNIYLWVFEKTNNVKKKYICFKNGILTHFFM